MVEQNLKKLGLRFQARIDYTLFESLYKERLDNTKIKISRGLDRYFRSSSLGTEKTLKAYVYSIEKKLLQQSEKELFENKKRLADAQRKLKIKFTKGAEKELGISERKIEILLRKIGLLQDSKPRPSDNRIFAMTWSPVLIHQNGQRLIVPMRYHLRPFGMPETFDQKYPGCYNARKDSLTGFWKRQFGTHHALILMTDFFENVKKHDFESRKLKKGEKEENIILQFSPKNTSEMLVPCIWDSWKGKGGEVLNSFALITDEPPKEVLEAGHNRCPIVIQDEDIEKWLKPKGVVQEELFSILSNKIRPKYIHEKVA